MKLVSVNTGLLREVSWHGRIVTTAIFKEPAGGRVALRTLNLDGDRQADQHGTGGELPMCMCGENFTIDDGGEGLLEESVYLGDRFSIGTAEVAVTQPRLP